MVSPLSHKVTQFLVTRPSWYLVKTRAWVFQLLAQASVITPPGRVSTPLQGFGKTPLGPEAGAGRPPPFLGIRTQAVSLPLRARLVVTLHRPVPSVLL